MLQEKTLILSAAGLTVNYVQGQFDSVESKYFESTNYLNSIRIQPEPLLICLQAQKQDVCYSVFGFCK